MNPDPSASPRLRRYLVVNLASMGSSIVLLAILFPVLDRSRHVITDIVVLSVAFAVLLASWWQARAGRTTISALGAMTGSWIAAFGVTYASPFAAPIGLLALLVPVVVVMEHVPGRFLRPLIVLTVGATGLLCAVGEYRRSDNDGMQPDAVLASVLLLAFVPLVVAVVTIGIGQQMGRLRGQAKELASSRRRLAVAADEARSAIERDLHDGAQQQLVTVSVELGRVTRLLAKEPERAAEELVTVRAQLQQAIHELRDLAHGIYPALLTERGLASALPAAGRRTSTACSVDVDDIGRLPRQLEAAIYFCCVEAIHNADKHAQATRIAVSVARSGNEVVFTVTDDGRGITNLSRSDGRGVTGMGDRIRAAGGELTIGNGHSGGTVVRGRVPITPASGS